MSELSVLLIRDRHAVSDGECHFPSMSPTAMLFAAHIIELLQNPAKTFCCWVELLPKINSDLTNLQLSPLSLVSVHLIFNDSRARLSSGLGYVDAWTTMGGLHKGGVGRSEARWG